jgi:hypothetical protein
LYYKLGFSVIEGSQEQDVKMNMSERKLRGGVNWQGDLKQKMGKTDVNNGWGYIIR